MVSLPPSGQQRENTTSYTCVHVHVFTTTQPESVVHSNEINCMIHRFIYTEHRFIYMYTVCKNDTRRAKVCLHVHVHTCRYAVCKKSASPASCFQRAFFHSHSSVLTRARRSLTRRVAPPRAECRSSPVRGGERRGRNSQAGAK